MTDMQAPEALETPRLRLRSPRQQDAKLIFESYAQDPIVTRYLVWLPHQSIETTEKFIALCIEQWANAAAFPYVITRKSDARLVGMIDLRPHQHGANIGYVLAKEHWGKGFMTEATRRVVEYALAQQGLYRVQAFCDVDNIASARVFGEKSVCAEKELYGAILFILRSRANHEIVTCTALRGRAPERNLFAERSLTFVRDDQRGPAVLVVHSEYLDCIRLIQAAQS